MHLMATIVEQWEDTDIYVLLGSSVSFYGFVHIILNAVYIYVTVTSMNKYYLYITMFDTEINHSFIHYLKNRKQSVKIGTHKSDWNSVHKGSAQDSLFGPFSYNVLL